MPNTSIDSRSQKDIDEEDTFLDFVTEIMKESKHIRFSEFLKTFADQNTAINFLNNGYEFTSCGKTYRLQIKQVKPLKKKNHEYKRPRKTQSPRS